NFYLNYWYGAAPGPQMDALMANLQKHGVVYLQTGNCFSNFPADNAFLINSSDAYVQDIGSQPGSAGYYTIDECIADLARCGCGQYDRVRRLDPDSMTFAALLPQPDAALWRDAVDVLSTDPYPMFGAEPPGGYRMSFVADGARQARAAVKDARPWM